MPPGSTANLSQDLIFDLSENTREEVLRYLPNVLGSLTLSGAARSVSRVIPKLLHVPPSEVIGHHFNQFLNMLDPCPLAVDFAEMLKPGSATLNLTVRCRGDQLIQAPIYFFVTHDTLGQPAGVLFVSHDGDEEEFRLRKVMAETADRVSRLITYGSSNAEIWSKLFDLCRESFATPGGWLIPRDAQGNRHLPLLFGPPPGPFVGPSTDTLPDTFSFHSLPTKQGEPLAANSLQCPWINPNMDFVGAKADTLPHALAPILNAKDESIGDLCLVAPPGHLFQRHELLLLDVITDQIGQALERGELHLPVQINGLSSHALTTRYRGLPELATFVGEILHHLSTLVPFVSAAAFLHEGDGMRLAAAINPLMPDVEGRFFPYDKNLLNAEVVRTRSRMVLDDVRQDSRFFVWEGYEYIRGWMGLPLVVNDAVIGMITLDSDRAGGFSQRDGEVAQAFANQAAIAVEKAQLVAALHMEKANLELLNQLNQGLAATLNPETVAAKALELIAQNFPGTFGEIYVVEPGQEFLQLMATENHVPAVIEQLPNQPYLRIGAGITGGAVELRRPILMPNVHDDPRWVHIPGLERQTESLTAVPLIAHNDVVGVLVLGSPDQGKITPDLLPLLQSIAASVALALQNASLFAAERRRREEADMLRNAASAVTLDLQLEQILTILLERLRQVVAFDSACILLLMGTDLHALAQIGLPQPDVVGQRFPVSNSFFAAIQREQRAIFFDDVQHLPRFSGWGGTSAIRGWMGVPLIHRGDMLGYITLDSLQAGRYGEEEAYLAQAFADQIAITIVNAQLLQESQQTARRQQEISTMLRGLNGALSLAEIHAAVADGLRRLIDPAAVEVAMYQPDEQQVNAVRSLWTENEDQASILTHSYTLDESAAIPTLLVGQTHTAPDIAHENQWPVEWAWAEQGFRSQVALPLQGSDRVLGHIRLLWRDGTPPDLTADFSLRQVADGVAMATERLNLLEQTTRRADELQVLAQLAGQLRSVGRRSEITRLTLNICRELFQADRGYVFVPADDGETLFLIDHVGKTPLSPIRVINISDSINGYVFTTGLPYYSPNLYEDPRASKITVNAWFDKGASFASAVYAPLRAGEQITGVLSLTYVETKRSFTQADLRLLSAMAEIAGNALHRNTILEGLEQRVSERTADLAQANARLLELDQMKSDFVANVSHELRTPLTNIKLYLDLLRNGRAERREHYLRVIETETEQLRALIESILELSTLEEGGSDVDSAPFVAVSLHEVMEETFQRFQEQATAAGLHLTYLPAGQPLTVLGNPGRLMQVTANLVKNAIAYTKPGGKVELSLVQNEQGEVGMVVRDTGIGISPEEINQIFERFYRAKQVKNSGIMGTGLGLSIVNKIVQGHGGRLAVDSVLGAGTTFTVWLPAHSL